VAAGASRLFSPEHADSAPAREALLHVLAQAPQAYGQPGTRWRLATLRAACPWLALHSLAGLSRLFQRLKIHWKRARHHVHSPDPAYRDKLHDIWVAVRGVRADPEADVLLFEDEFTLYRHPGLAQAFAPAGPRQPLAELGYKGNYTWRIAAALNVGTGQLVYQHARVMDVARLLIFYRKLTRAYPGQTILLVQDNWSVHHHPDLLAALQAQDFPYGLHAPPNWSRNFDRPVEHLQFPIRLLPLPTYASWTNPIEKLWRWLNQEVLHLHRYADDWPGLKQRVFAFLDGFRTGSTDLLRYVGLQDPLRLYQGLFPV